MSRWLDYSMLRLLLSMKIPVYRRDSRTVTNGARRPSSPAAIVPIVRSNLIRPILIPIITSNASKLSVLVNISAQNTNLTRC